MERAEDLLTLVLRTIRKEITPVMSLYDCRQIASYPTTLPLMRAFVDKTAAMEGKDGVLSVSIGHCFPYADVPELSGRILVITDNDKAKADALATEIGQEFISMRGRTAPDYLSIDAGHRCGAGVQCQPRGDGRSRRQCRRRRTHATTPPSCARLIERDVHDAAVGPIWDPIAVRLCFDAGVAPASLCVWRQDRPASGRADRCDGDRDRA